MDAAESEHVLVFDVASVCPAVVFDCDEGFVVGDVLGYIKFVGVVGSLAVSNFLSIYPDVKTTVHTIKVDVNLLVCPVRWNINLFSI